MNHNKGRSFYGGMGMARPVLTAMQADNARDFNYNKELYSDLASFESLSPQHGGREKYRSLSHWSAPGSSDEGHNDYLRTQRRRRDSFSGISTRLSKLTLRFRESITVYDEDITRRVNSCCDKDSAIDCL